MISANHNFSNNTLDHSRKVSSAFHAEPKSIFDWLLEADTKTSDDTDQPMDLYNYD